MKIKSACRFEISNLFISLLRFIAVAALYFFPAVADAQKTAQQVDKIMQSYHQLHQFDGTILIAKKGSVIFSKAYGLANREWNIPNTVHTKFRIASVTKQFTAVIVMQLKQEGKLALTDPISKHLSWYRKDVGGKVTIYDLLTQSSGVKDYTARADYSTDITLHAYTPIDFVTKFCSDSLEFQPGSKYAYSNSNYTILGAVIEAVTGASFEQTVKTRILQPVKLRNTGIDYPATVVNNRATGYDYEFGKYVIADYIDINSACFASGNLYSTTGDLFLWNTALHHRKLLSEKNMDTLLQPRFDGYAMGVHLNKAVIPGIRQPLTVFGHNGNINGFNAILTYIPEEDQTIILLRNEGLQSFKVDLNTILITLINVTHNLPYEMPKPTIVSVFADTVVHAGIEKGLAFFYSMKAHALHKYDISTEENDINTLGYYLSGHNRLNDALAVFKLNTEEFPASGNTFDSYGEALLQNGENQRPLKCIKKHWS